MPGELPRQGRRNKRSVPHPNLPARDQVEHDSPSSCSRGLVAASGQGPLLLIPDVLTLVERKASSVPLEGGVKAGATNAWRKRISGKGLAPRPATQCGRGSPECLFRTHWPCGQDRHAQGSGVPCPRDCAAYIICLYFQPGAEYLDSTLSPTSEGTPPQT